MFRDFASIRFSFLKELKQFTDINVQDMYGFGIRMGRKKRMRQNTLKKYPCYKLNCTPKVRLKALGVQFKFYNRDDLIFRALYPHV